MPAAGHEPLRQAQAEAESHEQAKRVEWLPVVDGTPNFLERIRLFSETFPSVTNQLGQNTGANPARHRSFWRGGFAPFASKKQPLANSFITPNGRSEERTALCPGQGPYGSKECVRPDWATKLNREQGEGYNLNSAPLFAIRAELNTLC